MNFEVKLITPADLGLMESALDCFSEVFDEHDTYTSKRPGSQYLQDLLSGDSFMCLVAIHNNTVIGALAAYELKKFEQQRSEIYIYDLAVLEKYRRLGVATALITCLKKKAQERGAWTIIVQADYIDEPAIRLYSRLGKREEILHFDIPVKPL